MTDAANTTQQPAVPSTDRTGGAGKAPDLTGGLPFNGTMKRLEVHGDLPGYRIQWANDDGNRIHTLIRYGFEFVRAEDVSLNDRVVDANAAVDDKVKRPVGTHAGGAPMYAYLMKCPTELWNKYQAQMQERPDQFDAMVQQGLIQSQELRGHAYRPEATRGTPMPTGVDSSELMQPNPNQTNPGGQRSRQPHRMGGPSIRNRT